jgi:hypothetical protein
MGLKGYRLWAMGPLDSICRAPPRCGASQLRKLLPKKRCNPDSADSAVDDAALPMTNPHSQPPELPEPSCSAAGCI